LETSPAFAEERQYARSLCWDDYDFLMWTASVGANGDLENRCGQAPDSQ